MKANKLSVNVKKTNYVIFKSKQRRIGTNIFLSLDGFVINQPKFVNFLGALIDDNVSWKCHINHIWISVYLYRCIFSSVLLFIYENQIILVLFL